MYALAQAYGMVAAGLSRAGARRRRRRALEDPRLDATARRCVLFGDGAGAVVLERVDEGGFLGFELGADGGGRQRPLPAGRRLAHAGERRDGRRRRHFVQMNGREVFKFATRVLVSSAEAVLDECGRDGRRRGRLRSAPGERPHHRPRCAEARRSRSEKSVVNVDRYGNTSSGSIPLALADAATTAGCEPGELVLMTGMGAGPHVGLGLIEWTATDGAT